jgi:hypothetical protein
MRFSKSAQTFTKFDGDQTLDELERYIRQMEQVFARRQPYYSVTWLKRYARSGEQTRRTAQWFKDRESQIRDLCVASAIISTSAAFRFALSAVFLIKPIIGPYTVCASFDETLRFGHEQLKKRGLRLPATIQNPWPIWRKIGAWRASSSSIRRRRSRCARRCSASATWRRRCARAGTRSRSTTPRRRRRRAITTPSPRASPRSRPTWSACT